MDGDGAAPRIKDEVIRLTQNEDYYFITSDRTPYPILALRSPLAEDNRLGVSYRVTDLNGTVTQMVGNYFTTRSETDTLQLKMIKPAKEDIKIDDVTVGEWAATRRLEMKNIYNLGARDIDPNTLNIQIHLDAGNLPTDLGGVSYLEVLGLDLENNLTQAAREDSARYSSQERGPDGRIDSRFIDLENGILFMPDLRPFDPSRVDLAGAPGSAPPAATGRAAGRSAGSGWTARRGSPSAWTGRHSRRRRPTRKETSTCTTGAT